MPSPRAISIGLSLLCGAVAPRLVVAQPTSSMADKKAEARRLTAEGLAALEAKDAPRALRSFEAAYALIPHPQLLYNLGRAQEQAGALEAGIARYEEFLAISPKDAYAADARRRLAAMKQAVAARERKAAEAQAAQAEAARVAAQRAADQAAADQAAKDKLAADQAAHDEPAADQASAGPVAAEVRTPAHDPPPRDPGRSLRLAGYGLGGAGVVAFGLAGYFANRGKALDDELSAPGAPYSRAKEQQGRDANRNLTIAVVSGGVLVGAGLTLYLLGRGHREHPTIAVAPTADGARLVWSGAF